MDNFRIKIKDFFNQKWRTSLKSKYSLNLTYKIMELIGEYERVYGMKMSQSQIVEFLVNQEFDRVKPLQNYDGIYLKSNISKLKSEYNLIKHGFQNEYYDKNLE